MSDVKWYLVDVEKRSLASSKFQIPPATARMSLMKGDFAKLIFENEEPMSTCVGERMWVLVTNALGEGCYIGVLHNHPVVVSGIDHGDAVEFKAEHVCEIEKKEK